MPRGKGWCSEQRGRLAHPVPPLCQPWGDPGDVAAPGSSKTPAGAPVAPPPAQGGPHLVLQSLLSPPTPSELQCPVRQSQASEHEGAVGEVCPKSDMPSEHEGRPRTWTQMHLACLPACLPAYTPLFIRFSIRQSVLLACPLTAALLQVSPSAEAGIFPPTAGLLERSCPPAAGCSQFPLPQRSLAKAHSGVSSLRLLGIQLL